MTELMATPVAEEACIDRKIEQKVAKMAAGQAEESDRREYNTLVLRRAHLVAQMGLSITNRYHETRKRVSGF